MKFLKQGTSPEKLALTISLGLIIGIFPMFGMPTVFATTASIYLRLNMPLIQVVNYIVYPAQLALFIPLINMSDIFFDFPEFAFSLTEVVAMFKADWLEAIKSLWLVNVRAIIGWIMVAVPVATLTYFSLLPILRKIEQRMQKPATT